MKLLHFTTPHTSDRLNKLHQHKQGITSMMLAERNSFAYEAGSPWSDSYRGNGWLHTCVPHPAWEIPGAAPEGRVGSQEIITMSDRVYNLDKEYGGRNSSATRWSC